MSRLLSGQFGFVAAALAMGACGSALACGLILPQVALQLDTPKTVEGIETVCTGVGIDAREDPRWAAYPLRVEIVGKAGQYLGEAIVHLEKADEPLTEVKCAGPWTLFKLPPGQYVAMAMVDGVVQREKVNISAKGQARVILRFTEGGATSKEYTPASS